MGVREEMPPNMIIIGPWPFCLTRVGRKSWHQTG